MKYLSILSALCIALLLAGCSSPTEPHQDPSLGWVGVSTEKTATGAYLITVYADLFGGDDSTLFTSYINVPQPGGDYSESFAYTLSMPAAGIRASHQFDLPAEVGSTGDPFTYRVTWGDASSDTYTGTLP